MYLGNDWAKLARKAVIGFAYLEGKRVERGADWVDWEQMGQTDEQLAYD